MSVTAVSSGGANAQLVKLANGEYTAASVTADPKDATRLGLIKENDGNYGTTPPANPDSKTSNGALAVLTSMSLGG